MLRRHLTACIALGLMLPPALQAQTAYYRHVIFDNSQRAGYNWNSSAQAVAPSTLEQQDWHLPVESMIFLSPPNALRLAWLSAPNGGWDAEIHLVNFPNRFPELSGTTLYFWVYAPQAIAAADLPELVLSDAREGLQVAAFPGSFTVSEPLAKYVGDIPAGKWLQLRVPMSGLKSASVYEFHPERLQSVIFHQGRADGVAHTLIVDEVRVADEPPASGAAAPPAPPTQLTAKGYDRHVLLRWEAAETAAARALRDLSLPRWWRVGADWHPAARDTSLFGFPGPRRRQGGLQGERSGLAEPRIGDERRRQRDDA